jgi:hypothetical protein
MATAWLNLHPTIRDYDTLHDVRRKMRQLYDVDEHTTDQFLREVCGSDQVRMIHGVFTNPLPVDPCEIVGRAFHGDQFTGASKRVYQNLRIYKQQFWPLADRRFGQPTQEPKPQQKVQEPELEPGPESESKPKESEQKEPLPTPQPALTIPEDWRLGCKVRAAVERLIAGGRPLEPGAPLKGDFGDLELSRDSQERALAVYEALRTKGSVTDPRLVRILRQRLPSLPNLLT